MRTFLIIILVIACICFLADRSEFFRIERIEKKDEFGFLRAISYKPTLDINKLFAYFGSLITIFRQNLFAFFEK